MINYNSVLFTKDIKDIGNLYFKQVFFEFEGDPIVFCCADKQEQLYLCICVVIRGFGEWIVVKTSENNLINLLECKIDTLEAFKSGMGLRYIIKEDDNGKVSVISYDYSSFPENYLPQKGGSIKSHFFEDGTKEFLIDIKSKVSKE